jgi:tetratricopeptide (TPR) repeat protein
VAAFPLVRRFGFARGFDRYDDEVEAGADGSMVIAQRRGTEVAAAVREDWSAGPAGRRFTWVHLFDAHTPHDAPRSYIRALRDEYLADVAVADRALGMVLRDARSAAGPHWVIVLGDHGESRGDHREATHGLFVYGATIRVPAVIWPAPPDLAAVSRRMFRLPDLPATAFDLVGLDPGDAPGDGVSVVRSSPPPAYAEARYAYYHFGWAPLAALQDGDWKYIEAPEPELYDLARDPGERDNVIDAEPDRASELAARLAVRAADTRETETAPLDEESRRALEALGYVTAPGTREDLPDPKRMLGVVQALEQVQALIGAGRPDAALPLLRRALALDPRNKDVHQTFGIVYTALGMHAEAAGSFRRALELPPHRNDRIPRFELASSLLRIGEASEAASELERIVADEPDDADAWYNLGVARQQGGDAPGANQAYRRALREDPYHALARQALGGSGGH